MAQEKYLGENGLKRLVGLVKEDLGTKANIDGSYDTMQVGSAKQIVSPTGITDTTPYIFRTTCGETSISGGDEQLASLKGIRGNTISWNQLINVSSKANTTLNGITLTNNANGSFTISGTASAETTFELNTYDYRLFTIVGHKYLLKATGLTGQSGTTYDVGVPGIGRIDGSSNYIIASCSSSANYVNLVVRNGTAITTPITFTPQLFDLTKMFGHGNEPTSVLEFTRLFPKPYYPYNEGEVRNAKTTGLKTIGYNAFDGDLEIGGIREDNGQNNDSITGVSRSKNYIKVVPGSSYTLEYPTTANLIIYEYDENNGYIESHSTSSTTSVSITLTNITRYVRFAIGNNDLTAKVSFHLTWSGSRTGYAPREEHVLHIDTSRYFPDGMNGFGGVYDELRPKTASKRFGKADLGTPDWYPGDGNRFSCYVSSFPNFKTPSSNAVKANILCPRYTTYPADDFSVFLHDMAISCPAGGVMLTIKDTRYADAATFKQAMSGIPLIYELAEPVVTEIPQVRDNHWEIKVDDYGTEEWLFNDGDEIPVPVGHETLYMDNLVDKLRNLPDPSEYKALESEVQTWVKLPPLPTDKTKVYVPKFVNGTIKWVEE